MELRRRGGERLRSRHRNDQTRLRRRCARRRPARRERRCGYGDGEHRIFRSPEGPGERRTGADEDRGRRGAKHPAAEVPPWAVRREGVLAATGRTFAGGSRGRRATGCREHGPAQERRSCAPVGRVHRFGGRHRTVGRQPHRPDGHVVHGWPPRRCADAAGRAAPHARRSPRALLAGLADQPRQQPDRLRCRRRDGTPGRRGDPVPGRRADSLRGGAVACVPEPARRTGGNWWTRWHVPPNP